MDVKIENALKEAYYLELRGNALYRESVSKEMAPELRQLFNFFAREEELHAKLLKDQLVALSAGDTLVFDEPPSEKQNGGFSLKQIAAAINAAGFESALVGAALDFERRAYEFYSKQSALADDPGIKALYTWLATWERQHMEIFLELDNEIREKIWYDNSFWPLD